MASILIRDHMRGTTTSLTVTDEDRIAMVKRWANADTLLCRLQNQPYFKDRLSYAELDTAHFKVLLALHLSLAADLPPQHSLNERHPVVKSLDILLRAFIVHFEAKMNGVVTGLTLDRLTHMGVEYEVWAKLRSDDMPKPKAALRIVVDNSKHGTQ